MSSNGRPRGQALPELVALIPAAGHARRLAGIAGSKEILPVGEAPDGRGGRRPKAVCEHLLEAMAEGGIERGFMVLRPGKEDVPAFLDELPEPPLRLSYPLIERSPNVPRTLDAAYSEVAGLRVALGFPDILIRPSSALAAVRQRQEATGADLVLGLFPTTHPERADMVELDPAGRPRGLRIRQRDVGLDYTWSIAVWTPRFTDFLHAELPRIEARVPQREVYAGDVVQAALERGFGAEAVAFPDGDSFDVGEPEALEEARRRFANEARGGA